MHYIALAIKDRRIVFYYSTGPSSSPAGISGRVINPLIVQEGQWYTIFAKYNRGWCSVSINDGVPVYTFSMAWRRSTKLDLSNWIYLAGLPDPSLNPIFEITSAYTGCISELSIDRRNVHLLKPVESNRIGKCGSACEGNQQCQNGGTCQSLTHDPGYFTCLCQLNYYGKYCENNYPANLPNPCIRAPCLHNGKCIPYRGQHYCLCQMPYYGLSNCGRGNIINSLMYDFLSFVFDYQTDEFIYGSSIV